MSKTGPKSRITTNEPLLREMFMLQQAMEMSDTELARSAGMTRDRIVVLRNPHHSMGKQVMVHEVRLIAAALGLELNMKLGAREEEEERPLRWLKSVEEA